ncbi:MAG: pantoate--beta-alanine ligase [Chloroflexi bacterium]|nr:pantoate--beta-alanine ligase [Chloroflexota bacterium]
MIVARTVAEFRAAREGVPAPLGFVPTMGYLHEGHLALVDAARAECATVVASIFVNPTQFGPNEDFERYPRDEDRDLALLEAAGTDLVLLPPVDEMYPPGDATRVRVDRITEGQEGARRPGHFEGVTTVVAKLFGMVQPDRAYFGEKDGQQLRVIRRMTRDLLLPIEIVACPTVREPDGLALSSRNVYLSAEERAQALSLSAGLRAASDAFEAGERDAGRLRAMVRERIESQPLADISYISLADSETLDEIEGVVERAAMLSLAVRFSGATLIDNVALEP